MGSVLTALHRGAQLAFAIECQHWQVHHGCPLLSTDKNGTILSKCDRRESVWRSRGDCNTACNVIQYDWWWSVSDGLRRHIHGRTRRPLLTGSQILGAIVRPYAGVVGYRFLLVLSDSWLHVLTSWFDPSDTARLYLRPSVISWLYAYNLLEVIQTTEPHFELLQQKSCKTDFLCVVFLVCLYVHTQIYVYMCNLVCYKFEIFKSEVWQVLVYLCLLCSWTVTYTVCSSVIHKFTKIKAKTTEHTVV